MRTDKNKKALDLYSFYDTAIEYARRYYNKTDYAQFCL